MIEIDGSYLEGGGQIARTALALSTLTNKPFSIDKIRVGRKQPGLKNQHLYCIKTLQQLCDAEAEGAELKSLELSYKPNKFKAKNIEVDIGTAGSITLLSQSLLIPSMFADKRFELKFIGGTDTAWSPPFDYLKNIILPHINRYCDIKLKLERRGFYPKGGGKVSVSFAPKIKIKDYKSVEEFISALREKFSPIDLTEQGKLIKVDGIAFASEDLMKAEVSERMGNAAKSILKDLNCPVNIQTEYSQAYSSGAGIVLWASFSEDVEEFDKENPVIIGADSLGERGKRAEIVGEDAAKHLLMEIKTGAAIDQHMADQLIPLLGLVGGKMKTSSTTQHTLTNIYATEQFLDVKFIVDGNLIEVKR